MKTFKKIFSLFLAVMLIAVSLPLSASAEYDIRVYGGHKFKINTDNGELVEYEGPGGAIIIPEGVVKIKPYLFWNDASITNVLLPASLLEIGDHAFDGSGLMGPLVIREDVTTIGSAAFQNTAITNVAMSPGVTKIGGGAFKNCKLLLTAEVFYIEIGEQAFSGCGLLHQVYIGPTALNIGARQFYNCASLKTFDVPGHVSKIEGYAFAGSGVKDMTIPGHVRVVGASAFERCPNLTRVHFDRGVEELGGSMFSTCPALKELWIPETVTSLKGYRPLSAEGYVVHGLRNSPVHKYIEEYNSLNHPDIPFVDDYDSPGFGSDDPNEEGPIGKCEDVKYDDTKGIVNVGEDGTISIRPTSPNDVLSITVNGKPVSFTKNNGRVELKDIRTTDKVVVEFGIPASVSFTDVPEKEYYASAVAWAVEKGITAGTDPTHFSPDSGLTRGQVVTFLWRMAGKPEHTWGSPFIDVKYGNYCHDAVVWAVENNITSGTSQIRFSPDKTCTRAEIATFLWRYYGRQDPAGSSNPFKDVSNSQYYAKAVRWAAENKIVYGTDETRFSPDKKCTRGQGVAFLYRSRNLR